jgi:hypothetical protein
MRRSRISEIFIREGLIPRPKNRDSWGGAGCDRDEVVIL